ncbi:hypothetical protein PMAYCL1PPCAC_26832, partial [Pristionchus mayeri]
SERVSEADAARTRLETERDELQIALKKLKDEGDRAQQTIEEREREMANLERQLHDTKRKLKIQIRTEDQIKNLKKERDDLAGKLEILEQVVNSDPHFELYL